MTARRAIDVAAWVRVPLDGLSVVPVLAGRSHTFSVDGHPVEIRLPKAPQRKPGHDGSWGNDQIWCSSWTTATGQPICFEIHAVDVFVSLKRQVGVPAAAIGQVNGRLFSESARGRLNQLSDNGERLAGIAIDRWARALRWKSRRTYLARPPISPAPRHGVYLVEQKTKQRFFPASIKLRGSVSQPLPAPAWKAAGSALRSAVEPPVWFDFLAEGEHRIRSGDLAGGLVHLAVAAETVIRELVLAAHAARPVDREFRLLVNQVSISRFVDRWQHLMARRPAWRGALKVSEMKSLFELRNRLLHRAEPVNAGQCRQFAQTVRQLVLFAEQRLANQRLQPTAAGAILSRRG